MLMLTHTYLLQQIMSASDIKHADPDIYIYNIAPDLLTLHPDINSNQTHSVTRFITAPPDHKLTAYIMFHLLVDDLAHYGKISLTCQEGFDPHAEGYSYIKGRGLIDSILNLYKIAGRDITYNEAAYRSHLIIEMIYDLFILPHIHADKSIELLVDAIHFTFDHRCNQFCYDISWLYGIDQDHVLQVLKNAISYITQERLERIMNMEGRIRLFSDKFGLRNDDSVFAEEIQSLFRDALNSIESDEFLQQTNTAIRICGWMPPD